MSSFGTTVSEVENQLNNDLCGNNLPSLSEAFVITPPSAISATSLTKFQKSVQAALSATSVNRLLIQMK